jgi:sugar phosphate isomerase/epimerase
VLPEFDPPTVVEAAAAAGFAAVGVWFDPQTWTESVGRSVADRLDSTGVEALDIEPLFVGPDGDEGDRLLDAAAMVGAQHVLTVSRGLGVPQFAERFGELCDLAAPSHITVVVEFTRLYTIDSLTAAREVLRICDRPNAGILVDNLHLARCGLDPSHLGAGSGAEFPYIQLSDAPLAPADPSPEGLLHEARHGRCNLGDGALPIAEFLRAFAPDAPVSLEVRSAEMRASLRDPVDRAASVLRAFRRSFPE